MDQALRPMSTSQVLDRTFSLYRSNFVLFAGIALISPALTLISSLAQLAIFGMPFIPEPGKLDPHMVQQYMMRSFIAFGATIITYAIGTAFASSATIYAVSMVHLGKTTTIRDCYAKIRPIVARIMGLLARVFFLAFWPILAGYALMALAAISLVGLGKNAGISSAMLGIIAGLLAFVTIVGGLVWIFIAFCRYALAVPACTLEGLPGKISIIRSKFLTQGRKGDIFLIYLLTGILTLALTYALQAPALLANNIGMLTARSHLGTGALVWMNLANFLSGAIAGPIITVALALMYYDQRVRKEAFDLQLMMEAIGLPQQAQGQSAGGASSSIG
ncbi:MAG: hypothetical protein ACRD4F_11090 [Candidatus Angelobacter sp.]